MRMLRIATPRRYRVSTLNLLSYLPSLGTCCHRAPPRRCGVHKGEEQGNTNVLCMERSCISLTQGSKGFLEFKRDHMHRTAVSYGEASESMQARQHSIRSASRTPRIRELLSLKTTVSSKMQVTIPTTLAKLFDIRPRDVLRFTKLETVTRTRNLVVEVVRGGRRYQTFRVRAPMSPIIPMT